MAKTEQSGGKTLANGRKKFYVTTPIYYVNDKPHIGHAYTSTATDVLARWHRLLGDDTFLLTGTDENTLKLVEKAKKEGVEPREIADRYAERFEASAKVMEISYDRFIRTTDEAKHHPGAQEIWKRIESAGHIYKGTYEGLYCVDCEAYYTEKDLTDGKCPIHSTPPQKLKEENYFFKLSAFGDQVKEAIDSGKYEVVPETRRNEILSVIAGGLKDVSCSRPADKLTMGVPVPGDDTQRMYVWFEALTNYLNGIGFGWDEKRFARYWPADIHVIGKEISRFHAAIWPAMLLAAELPLPKKLYVHGFFTMEGEKMSKSKGNVVDPFELVEKHGVDPVRYYLLRALPYAEDGDFSERRFKEMYDSELANDLGNLASRVLTLVEKKCDGKVPEGKADPKLKEHVAQTHHELANLLDAPKFAEALERLNGLVSLANRFIEENKVYQQEGDDLNGSLYTLAQTLGHLALLYQPFIPGKAGELQQRLGLKPDGWDADSLLEWEKVPAGTKVAKGEPLFPK
ncbi:MAG: methionine--tRNA ligase [bacterium]|nr:methionine--tRNA ligase [bacterium]MDZ4248324.1 methionine--tRNA ligase [Patescibacteria group bacterium]